MIIIMEVDGSTSHSPLLCSNFHVNILMMTININLMKIARERGVIY